MPSPLSSCSSWLRVALQTSLFMGAWEVRAALNAACVPASTAADNEPFQGAGTGIAVAALPASTGSGDKQAAGSVLGVPGSQGPLLQTRGHLPPQPCHPSVAVPSAPGHAGRLVSVAFPLKPGWGGGWRVGALAEVPTGSPRWSRGDTKAM